MHYDREAANEIAARAAAGEWDPLPLAGVLVRVDTTGGFAADVAALLTDALARIERAPSSDVIALIGNLSRDLRPGAAPRRRRSVPRRARAPAPARAREDRRALRAADRDALLPPLVRLGTPVRYVPGKQTASFLLLVQRRAARRCRSMRSATRWLPQDLPELPSTRWAHVAPLARHEFPAETITRSPAAVASRSTARASSGFRRSARSDSTPTTIRELLRHIWALKLAEEEAEVIGDAEGARGPRGARHSRLAWRRPCTAGGTHELVSSRELDADPTGAGDAFMTGYIVARNAGFGPVGAARRATAVVAAVLAGR